MDLWNGNAGKEEWPMRDKWEDRGVGAIHVSILSWKTR